MEQDWGLQAPKPPLLKGGAPEGRGDSVYRKSVGRDDHGAPSLAAGGFRQMKEPKVKGIPQLAPLTS